MDVFGLAPWPRGQFNSWFDNASPQDIIDNKSSVERALRNGGGLHEKFPVSSAPEMRNLGFTADELKKATVSTKGLDFVDVYNHVEKEELNLSTLIIDKKYFEIAPDTEEYMEQEHLFFEENGMGLDISKQQNIPFFEQDIINPSPKYQFYLQLLEEDIETKFRIFQTGIGYFYVNKSIKKLKSGDEAGIFFIQNT